ncbi:GTP-binding protein [Jeotgalicoccus sp. WY2]|uniref:GTP-binding protein n=1 Tax=Jeotgalicoccus sp. WY2 TaxID=2708346 RepID=UPI001BD51F86|nr:GTP-binding protein [Jeotgalicoccus sp. WY2]
MITGERTTIGILAHVDAGKTTLTEALLCHAGVITKRGRVDHGDTYFDFESIERQRGITVSSKQADFEIDDRKFTLIDTPGHADLSAEMERSLQILDLAIIVVSAVDGVQSHTATIFQLLEKYDVPAIIYINKNDRPNVDKKKLWTACRSWMNAVHYFQKRIQS